MRTDKQKVSKPTSNIAYNNNNNNLNEENSK